VRPTLNKQRVERIEQELKDAVAADIAIEWIMTNGFPVMGGQTIQFSANTSTDTGAQSGSTQAMAYIELAMSAMRDDIMKTALALADESIAKVENL